MLLNALKCLTNIVKGKRQHREMALLDLPVDNRFSGKLIEKRIERRERCIQLFLKFTLFVVVGPMS